MKELNKYLERSKIRKIPSGNGTVYLSREGDGIAFVPAGLEDIEEYKPQK